MTTAEEWVAGYLEANRIDWDKLTPAERFRVGMHVPCNIRCFRIGDAVDVNPGEPCPECGKLQPALVEKPMNTLVPVLDNPSGCEHSSDGEHSAYLSNTEVYCRLCDKKLGVLKPKDELGGQSDSGTP